MSSISMLCSRPETVFLIFCVSFFALFFSSKTLFVTLPLISICLYCNNFENIAGVLLVIWIFFLIAQWNVAGYSTEKDHKPTWFIVTILLVAILSDILFNLIVVRQFYQSFMDILPFVVLGFLVFPCLLFWGIQYIICPLVIYGKSGRMAELTNHYAIKNRKSTDYILIFEGERYNVSPWTYRRLKNKKGQVFSYIRCDCLMGVICIRSLKLIKGGESLV